MMKKNWIATFSLMVAGAALMVPQISTPALAQTTASIQRGASGLPLPRFVSLKAGRVNMRIGPGREYGVAWRYVRAGVPFEIIQEYDNWRRVRDADGTVGWIHGSLLSGQRTAVTAPWQRGNSTEAALLDLHREPRANSGIVAQLQPGVIGEVEGCDGAWCEFSVYDKNTDRTYRGYASQAELWGAYPDEVFD